MDCENCNAKNGEWVGNDGEEIALCPPCQEAIQKNNLDIETEQEALRN